MIDVSVSYNNYKFLGHEFLTWLWYIIENDRSKLINEEDEQISLEIGNRIVIENLSQDETVESITIKGNDAGLEEGKISLKKGAVVTDIHLAYKDGDSEWFFSLRGESMNISGLKTPETAKIEKKDDIEGAVLEKAFLCDKPIMLVEALFNQFVKLRVTDTWNKNTVLKIKSWIYS